MTAIREKILVWDPIVRISHWLLLTAFVVSYLTGEEETDLHFYSGYLILAIVVTRVVWGFIGSEHARFRSFLTSPVEAVGYLRGLFTGKAHHYVGHNPAAAMMTLALLISVLLTAGAGLTLHGYRGDGPLAFLRAAPAAGVPTASTVTEEQGLAAFRERRRHDDDDDDDDDDEAEEHERREFSAREGAEHGAAATGERRERARRTPEQRQTMHFWKETHEFFANLTILLIILHIGGVLMSSWRHKENLIKSMVNGYKEQDPGVTAD